MMLNGPLAIPTHAAPAASGATWLMFRDFARPPAAGGSTPHAESLHMKGSLVLEFRPRRGAGLLLHLEASSPGPGLAPARIMQDRQGGISLHLFPGHGQRIIRLSHMPDAATWPCRLTWAWDIGRERGWLTLENLQDGRLKQVEFIQRMAPDTASLPRLAERQPLPGAMPRITMQAGFIGLSRVIEPVGLVAGIGAGTPIETPHGPRPIEDLRPGDHVLTERGPLPVRAVPGREVPCAGHFAPLRLRAPFLGLRHAITLAPEQRILLAGSEIEYLFGHERVLCELGQLQKLRITMPETRSKRMRMYQLLLDRPAILNAAGCRIESLDIGRIRNAPGLVATSILSGLRRDELPLHESPACPVLAPHEARALTGNGCTIRQPALCPCAETIG